MKWMKRMIAVMTAVIIGIFTVLPVQALTENTDPDAPVKVWNIEKSGENYVLTLKIRHNTDWDWDGINQKQFQITYADASAGTDENKALQFDYGCNVIKNGQYGDIAGASVTKSQDEKDTLTITSVIPASFFAEDNFTVSFNNQSIQVSAEATPLPTATPAPSEAPVTADPAESAQPQSDGTIVIDGKFSDWQNEKMTDMPETDGDRNVGDTAMLIQGDRLYIYVQGGNNQSETYAGPNHNGKYAVTTDNGRTLLLQLNADGTVTGGTPGMKYGHSGSQWEISIPLSELPSYQKTVQFGLYGVTPAVTVTDPDHQIPAGGSFAIDGDYSDWDQYPHSLIAYDTPGIQKTKVDGEAAVYYDASDRKILGHVTTENPDHLNARGYDLITGVTLALNETSSSQNALKFMLASENTDGTINWNPTLTGLPDGTYVFDIFDTGAWRSAKTVNEEDENNVCYGKLYLTVQDGREDAEWEVDAVKAAKKYNMDTTDIKTVNTQYVRIGNQWISGGGASSGSAGGIAIAAGAVILPLLLRRKRQNGVSC